MMNHHRLKTAAGRVFLAAMLFQLMPSAPAAARPFKSVLERLKRNIAPLDLDSMSRPLPAAETYFRYYGIDYENAAHHFGYFQSAGYRLAAHVFKPKDARGTVFLLHGYLDHVGLMKNLITLLLDMQYSVAAYDLPGHGLSSGEPAAVSDFSTYVTVFDEFRRLFASQLPGPQHLIGHSTGCAIAYEYLHGSAGINLDRVIFIAPLVHTNHWLLSKIGYMLAETLVEKVPRKIKENTSDKNYLEFLARDPLQSRSIPLRWIRAMYAWEEKIQAYPKLDQPVFIIQGKDDTVVDWRYNISFLKNSVGPIRIRLIPGAKHQLINERIDLRSRAFHEIRDYLEKGRDRFP